MNGEELRVVIDRGQMAEEELSGGLTVQTLRDALSSVRGLLLGTSPTVGGATFMILAAKREAYEDILRELEAASFAGREAQAKLAGEYSPPPTRIC